MWSWWLEVGLLGGLSGGELWGEWCGVGSGVVSICGKLGREEGAILTCGPWPPSDDDSLTDGFGGGPCERKCGIHYKQGPALQKQTLVTKTQNKTKQSARICQ